MNKSQIIDTFLSEACINERISDGIFNVENPEHMDVLREVFVKYGLTKEDAITLHNKMLEGKYPERQAYNKNGILVTFPTPEYKQRAIKRGTHTEQNPLKQQGAPIFKGDTETSPSPDNAAPPAEPPPQGGEQPSSLPSSGVQPTGGAEPPTSTLPKAPAGGEPQTVPQGDKQVNIEPSKDQSKDKVEAPPMPPEPPKTPRTKAAEKAVVKQIFSTDDTALSSTPTLDEDKEILRYQLNELYKKADFWGLNEAAKFLKEYIK